MLAFALSGIYAIVDGFFVGNSVGDQGLATINLVYPLVALIQAAGTGVGMAGAIHFAIAEGGKRINERNRYFWITCGLLIAVSLLLTLVYLPLNKRCCTFWECRDNWKSTGCNICGLSRQASYFRCWASDWCR